MRSKTLLIYVVSFFVLCPGAVHALDDGVSLPVLHTTDEIKERIIEAAQENNVDIDLALYVAEKESDFTATTVGDMNIVCKRTGKPVRARGIYQWTECYFPHVSDEQAFDPVWSIEHAMQFLKDKRMCKITWTTCRWYYAQKIIGKK